MSVNYNDALKSIRMAAVIAAIDADDDPARMIITDASNTVLVSITLAKPSFDLSGADVITLLGVPLSASPLANGPASLARIEDGNGTIVVSGMSVGITGAADVILNAVAITLGTPVTINSGTITHG